MTIKKIGSRKHPKQCITKKKGKQGNEKEKREGRVSKLDVVSRVADQVTYLWYGKIHVGEGFFTLWKN
jgi:hypothetical protein